MPNQGNGQRHQGEGLRRLVVADDLFQLVQADGDCGHDQKQGNYRVVYGF